MIASAERLMEGEKYRDDLAAAKPLKEIKEFYEKDLTSIGLDSVSFKYDPVSENPEEYDKSDMPVVLKDLSLDIKKGEIVAFTGHSGCGKSTALVLLMCVYKADEGLRYFCGKDGIKHELTDDYRRLFAYVPQGNALMNGTIRDAVCFAEPKDDERLKRALKIACADEFVEDADAELGERGSGLSEGQMQRLAIARAVYSDAPVLLLDEATSALDEATEKRLLENLRGMTDRTVVIVTHRKAALSICDRILEFSEDGVKER
jgi:ATP-binding cassette subfamily B protein